MQERVSWVELATLQLARENKDVMYGQRGATWSIWIGFAIQLVPAGELGRNQIGIGEQPTARGFRRDHERIYS
jgi:hypothetical protein